MNDLVEFLLARIAEDEAAARAAVESHGAYQWGDDAAEEAVEMAEGEGCSAVGIAHLRRWLPARVLAECDAKRRIVEHHTPVYDPRGMKPRDVCLHTSDNPCPTLRFLALPYANHPDYDPSWRP